MQSSTSVGDARSNTPIRYKPISFLRHCVLFVVGAIIILLNYHGLWSSINRNPSLIFSFSSHPKHNVPKVSEPLGSSEAVQGENMHYDTPNATFYDEPSLSYSIEQPMKNWDEKRRQWLGLHSSFYVGVHDRILMVTGSQPSACKNPIGDHLLLRFFKNKVDYCRIHGYELFYNNAFLHHEMRSYWAKLPLVRAAMIAHPEAEWIWWVDSDAAFTDMEFKIPLERYKNHNLIVNGWPYLIFEEKSWVGLNAGIFLIRNCQWSMDLLDAWARMGPQTPNYEAWGKTLKSIFSDKIFPESDDQSALIYLLLKENEKWGDKIYIENEYALHGYWKGLVEKFDKIIDNYVAIEGEVRALRRRHAEKVSEYYGALRDHYLKHGERRPFVTHFTGCQPCNGDHNERYSWETCLKEMERALNFADNQVLRNFGYSRQNLLDSSSVYYMRTFHDKPNY